MKLFLSLLDICWIRYGKNRSIRKVKRKHAAALPQRGAYTPSYYTIEEFSERRKLRDKLIKEIKTTALAGEKFLENVKDSKDKKVQELADTVRKLQGLMSHDMNLLQQNDPNGPGKKSLPELQEDARTATVDIGAKDFEKMSGFQSERIPMILRDAKGKKISGFFTKASKFTILPGSRPRAVSDIIV